MKAAVVQMGSVVFDAGATLVTVEKMCRDAAAADAKLAVFPEASLGGYPTGLDFGARVGSRTEAGRDDFARYFHGAVTVPGPETEQLAAWSKELGLHIVIGVIERALGTLYCTGLLFTPDRGLVLRHRKIMPTGAERLIWGQGGASTMNIAETELGRIGIAICWENYMPLYRQHLYEQGVQIWCAPTVDTREVWGVSMRHIAYEGRCYVLSACQHLTKETWPHGEIPGASLIVSPSGNVIAGPQSGEGILFANLDMNQIPRYKYDLDVAGHYNRADLFTFRVRNEG